MPLQAKVPQASADVMEHADWIELEAIRSLDGSSSIEELARNVRMTATTETMSDEEQEDPHDAGGEQSRAIADDAWHEIERRQLACGDRYPFEVTGASLTLIEGWESSAYIFQLLLSKFGLDAGGKKKHPDRDFELISAYAVKEYLGGDANAASMNKFGHPRLDRSGFKKALNALCKEMNSGAVNNDAQGISNKKDGGLDVVAWIPFKDEQSSQLIAFGQCATGQNWLRGKLSDINPREFREQWLREGWYPEPIKAIFVPHSIRSTDWRDVMVRGGLIFDRCRITSLTLDLTGDLADRCKNWVNDVVGHMNNSN